MSRNLHFFIATLPAFAATGCGLILGVDDFTDAPGSSGGGGTGGTTDTGGGGTGGTTMTGGGGTGGTTMTGGGGTGGTTMVCMPGDKMPCYDGPAGTEGMGICMAGIMKCNIEGTGYGACEGQVLPEAEENCLKPTDDDCDGLVDQNKTCCTPNEVISCYTGPAGTVNQGQCKPGMVLCPADGLIPADCPNEVLPADEFCASSDDEDCNGRNCWIWTQSKGLFGEEYGSAIATDPFQKRIVVAGSFDGAFDLGGGLVQPADDMKDDAFLAAYAPDGTHLFSKGIGTAASEYFLDVEWGSTTGIAVVGYYLFGDTDLGNGPLGPAEGLDGFLAIYGADGAPILDRKIGGQGADIVYSTSITSDGVMVAGQFDSTVLILEGEAGANGTLSNTTTTGTNDVFVAKYKPVGGFVWATKIGGSGADNTTTTAATMDADFVSGVSYVAGTTNGVLTIGSVTLPTTTTLFFTKLNSGGNPVWAKGYNVQGQLFHVASTPQGPYLAGTLTGTSTFVPGMALTPAGKDAVVNHYDVDGTLVWSKLFGGTGDEDLIAIAPDNTGGLVIAVRYTAPFSVGGVTLPGPNMPGGGNFVARLDSAGNVTWVHALGAVVSDLAVDTDGFTLMTGGFDGTVNFGGGAVTAVGNTDLFFGKLGK